MKPMLHALVALAATLGLTCAHAAVGRLAHIAIHDRATGQELPVHWHEGRAYVVGKPGNEYQVIVRNRWQEDLLAVVSVDGVNAVTGETAGPKQSGYVLSPWEETRISGWRKSLGETAAFYFTSLPDSYAARTGRPDNVGVIGVAVFQRRMYPPQTVTPLASAAPPAQRRERHGADAMPPAAAAEAQDSSSSKATAPLGTGHGRREDNPVREVVFERRTRQPVETLAIYYDSYRNLVARGVIATPIARRAPDPFPSRFTPDP